MSESEECEAPPLPPAKTIQEDLEEEFEELEEEIINKIKHPSDRQFFIMAFLALVGLAVAVGSPFIYEAWKEHRAAKAAPQVPAGHVILTQAEFDHLKEFALQGDKVKKLLYSSEVGAELYASNDTNSPLWKRIR